MTFMIVSLKRIGKLSIFFRQKKRKKRKKKGLANCIVKKQKKNG